MTPWAERGLAAQEADHLICFKVKDTAKVKGEETVDLFFPGLQPPKGVDGCEVKKAEKLVCLSTIKDNGNDNRGAGLAPAYVCYTVECPEDAFTARAFDAITQFGTHRIAAGTLGSEDAQLLCARRPSSSHHPDLPACLKVSWAPLGVRRSAERGNDCTQCIFNKRIV
jgi:hypothetical protein